jgi:hypothetical protein
MLLYQQNDMLKWPAQKPVGPAHDGHEKDRPGGQLDKVQSFFKARPVLKYRTNTPA